RRCIGAARRRHGRVGGRRRHQRRIGKGRWLGQDGRRSARPLRGVQHRIFVFFITERSTHDRLSHVGGGTTDEKMRRKLVSVVGPSPVFVRPSFVGFSGARAPGST